MAAKSSSSFVEGRRRLRPEIPLITCPDCRRHTVRELVVKTNENGNKGRIFYRCPGGKRGSGCQYLRFEEDYLVDLKKSRKNQSK